MHIHETTALSDSAPPGLPAKNVTSAHPPNHPPRRARDWRDETPGRESIRGHHRILHGWRPRTWSWTGCAALRCVQPYHASPSIGRPRSTSVLHGDALPRSNHRDEGAAARRRGQCCCCGGGGGGERASASPMQAVGGAAQGSHSRAETGADAVSSLQDGGAPGWRGCECNARSYRSNSVFAMRAESDGRAGGARMAAWLVWGVRVWVGGVVPWFSGGEEALGRRLTWWCGWGGE